jgi:glucosamine 6-phosphate synthetase-like amidotransferase/phosphosugar isomerase protein
MASDLRKEIHELPAALRETLEKGRPEYERLIRQTRWGELPVYFLGRGHGLAAGLSGALACATLLEWPAVVHTPEDFNAYCLPVLRPRSVLCFISTGKESPETLEAAKSAHARGATVLALVESPQNPIAQESDGIFLVRAGQDSGKGISVAICQAAAINFIVFLMARALKRSSTQFDTLEEEFAKLPDHMTWVFTQLPQAMDSLAAELMAQEEVTLLAGGFYYPAALHAALLLSRIGGVRTEAVNATALLPSEMASLAHRPTLLAISGSRMRVRKRVYEAVDTAKRSGARIVSLTDGNDPEVSRRSALSLLLPVLSEMTGATMAVGVLAWVAGQCSRHGKRTR